MEDAAHDLVGRRFAAMAKVRRLVLSHIAPAVEWESAAVLSSVRATFNGRVDVAQDCMVVDVGHPP